MKGGIGSLSSIYPGCVGHILAVTLASLYSYTHSREIVSTTSTVSLPLPSLESINFCQLFSELAGKHTDCKLLNTSDLVGVLSYPLLEDFDKSWLCPLRYCVVNDRTTKVQM